MPSRVAPRALDILRTAGARLPGAEAWLRRTPLRAGVALVYHGVSTRSGDRARELVPAHGAELLKDQLAMLHDRYRLVAPSQLLAAAAGRRRGAPFPVALTFDDDLASHAELAAPILAAAEAPAAFFLCGASLDAPHAFWWEQLQLLADEGRADEDLVRMVLPEDHRDADDREAPLVKRMARRIQLLPPAARSRVEQALGERAGPPEAGSGLRAAAVRRLAEAGFEIGFHTLRHHFLPSLAPDELERALLEGREQLAEAAGEQQLDAISYPHGGGDARVAASAKSLGYRLGFTGRPEPARGGGDPLLVGRVEPSYHSVEELAGQLVVALLSRPSDGRG